MASIKPITNAVGEQKQQVDSQSAHRLRSTARKPLCRQYARKPGLIERAAKQGEEVVGELMECHSVAQKVCGADHEVSVLIRAG